MKYLIVGLGNIGPEYENTRHNIGFLMADALVASCQGPDYKPVRHGLLSYCKYKGRQILVLKPSTYMNLSGKAVSYWLQKESISLDHLMVLVDDLALSFGSVRIRSKGSDGGHNGLKSIQEYLEKTDYARLRFGIGNEFRQGMQVDYVLSLFDEEEKHMLPDRLTYAADAVKGFTTIGIERSMNMYNKK